MARHHFVSVFGPGASAGLKWRPAASSEGCVASPTGWEAASTPRSRSTTSRPAESSTTCSGSSRAPRTPVGSRQRVYQPPFLVLLNWYFQVCASSECFIKGAIDNLDDIQPLGWRHPPTPHPPSLPCHSVAQPSCCTTFMFHGRLEWDSVMSSVESFVVDQWIHFATCSFTLAMELGYFLHSLATAKTLVCCCHRGTMWCQRRDTIVWLFGSRNPTSDTLHRDKHNIHFGSVNICKHNLNKKLTIIIELNEINGMLKCKSQRCSS